MSFDRVFTVIRSEFEVDLSQNVENRRKFTTFSRNSMASQILVGFHSDSLRYSVMGDGVTDHDVLDIGINKTYSYLISPLCTSA